MIRPERPAWEISMQKAGHIFLAVLFAAVGALIVWKLSFWRLIGQTVGVVFFLVTFLVFTAVFYAFLEWIRRRPDEIAKTVLISSKELRRRTKQFFDNLPK